MNKKQITITYDEEITYVEMAKLITDKLMENEFEHTKKGLAEGMEEGFRYIKEHCVIPKSKDV